MYNLITGDEHNIVTTQRHAPPHPLESTEQNRSSVSRTGSTDSFNSRTSLKPRKSSITPQEVNGEQKRLPSTDQTYRENQDLKQADMQQRLFATTESPGPNHTPDVQQSVEIANSNDQHIMDQNQSYYASQDSHDTINNDFQKEVTGADKDYYTSQDEHQEYVADPNQQYQDYPADPNQQYPEQYSAEDYAGDPSQYPSDYGYDPNNPDHQQYMSQEQYEQYHGEMQYTEGGEEFSTDQQYQQQPAQNSKEPLQ